MKGHMFQLFEEFVKEKYGEPALDELYEAAGIPEDVLPFLKPLSYPDSYLQQMIVALSSKTSLSTDQIIYEYGKHLVPGLFNMYPSAVKNVKSASELLAKVDRIHTMEILKLYPDAAPPLIKLERWDEQRNEGTLIYCSPKHLCKLVEGVLEGLGIWYQEKITCQQVNCMKKGDKECVYKISIVRKSS